MQSGENQIKVCRMYRPFLLFFAGIFLALSNVLNAQPTGNLPPFHEEYIGHKYAIMGNVERCEIIGARDISALQYMPVPVLKDDWKNIETLFQATQKTRSTCYETALAQFNDLLNKAQAYTKDSAMLRQYALDESVANMLHLRRTVALMLLDSTLSDIQQAIHDYTEQPHTKSDGLFYAESLRTRNLVKEELALIMEMDRRQLAQDELHLLLLDQPDPTLFTRTKLAAVHHFLTQATLAFEDAYTQPKLLLLARLNTDLATGAAKLEEVKAFAPTLPEIFMKRFEKVAQNTRQLQRQLENFYANMSQEEAEIDIDFETEFQNLYTEISNLNSQILELLGELRPKPVSTADFAEAMQDSLMDLEAQEAPISDLLPENALLPAKNPKKSEEPAQKSAISEIPEKVGSMEPKNQPAANSDAPAPAQNLTGDGLPQEENLTVPAVIELPAITTP